MSSHQRVLEALIDASRRKDHDAFLALLTDDVEYHWSMTHRPAVGKEKLRKFLRNYEARFDQQAWIVHRVVEQGDLMMVEGVERILDKGRGVVVENPYMQSYEFRGDLIHRLRDYYDPTLLNPPAPPTRHQETLKRIQAVVAARDLDAYLAFFADDAVYHYHVGSRPLVGKDWIAKFMRRYWEKHSETRWTILAAAEHGDRLLTEGVEEYVNAAGESVRHPYMGIIEFRGDLIVAWRDYFQMMDPAATPPIAKTAPGAGTPT